MRFLDQLMALVLGCALLGLWAAPVHAAPASASTYLNVRSGPGPSFGVVDVLTPGERVDMTECQTNGWCYITHDGPDGWVSSTYLTAAPGAVLPNDDCSFQLTIGPDGPRFSIVCGGAVPGTPFPFPFPAPAPTPVGSQACFYDLPNFTGDVFCRGPGTYNTIPYWANNRITSVQLWGAARVRLCADINLGGFCRVVTTSEGQLGGLLNNRVSSLQVFIGTSPVPRPLPTAFSSGQIVLPDTLRADLDNGTVGAIGADIWYRVFGSPTPRLVPINGARFARGDGSDRGYARCSIETFTANPLPITALPVGTYVCARTNEGRISQFRIRAILVNGIQIEYTTFN